MHKHTLPAIAALVLATVAFQSRATGSAPVAVAPMEGVGWHLTHEGDMAKLAYGLAHSDQIALMMTCEPGAAHAIVYGQAQPATSRLVLASQAEAPIDPLAGGLIDEARVPLDDRVMQAFRRSGRLVVQGEGQPAQLTARPDERAQVAAFFSHCAAARA